VFSRVFSVSQRTRHHDRRVTSPPIFSDETKTAAEREIARVEISEAISHHRLGRHSGAVPQILHRSSGTVVK
jgi:hypothetical protein